MKHAETGARSFIKTSYCLPGKRDRQNHPLAVSPSCFLNGWPTHHQCVIVFSVVLWFPKWINMQKLTWQKILEKPKHRLPQVFTARGCLMFFQRSTCVLAVLTCVFFWDSRLWGSTAVWRKRRTCCCPLCQPCRRKLNIWSTTWAQRLASNWTCSRLWETPAGSWKSLKVLALCLLVLFVYGLHDITKNCIRLKCYLEEKRVRVWKSASNSTTRWPWSSVCSFYLQVYNKWSPA